MDRQIRVLHVDDDPAVADLTATFLEREDDRFVVETASSAEEALERLEAEQFDSVISDYEMPGTNGIELLESVREQSPALPFILFTGKGSEAVASDAISAGVTDYLQKESGTDQYAILANRLHNAVDKRRAEERLERQNDLFAKAQEIADVGAWEYDPEADRLRWTEQVYHIHGLPTSFEPSIETVREYYYPEDRPAFREAIDRAIRETEPYDLEVRLRRPDGEQRWMRAVGEPKVEDGEVVLVRGVIRDVTERRHRERELERERERYQSLFESSINGIAIHEIVTDDDGEPIDYVFLEVNEAFEEMTGLDADAIVGERATDVIEGIEETEFIETYGRVALEDQSIRFEQYSEPLDRHYDIAAFSPGEGQFITVFSDVTDRKERERRLQRQNQRFDQFAEVISHDLQTPLTTAQGRLELALETGDLEHAEDALAAVLRDRELVGDREPVDLGTILEEAWETLERPDGATLRSPTELSIAADPFALRRCLENLLSNAIDHGGEEPTVRVGPIENGFCVEDDGPGIPPERRETVFDPGMSTKAEGSGMGLTSVRQIVRSHGWRITIEESETLDGTRFEITGVDRVPDDRAPDS